MIKDVEKIAYDRLFNASEYNALNPKPTIHQEVAPLETPNPVIVINSISTGKPNNVGARIQVIQFSIWHDSKAGIFPIQSAIAQIFNRWTSEDIEFSFLLASTWAYDSKEEIFGLHMPVGFKVYDPEY